MMYVPINKTATKLDSYNNNIFEWEWETVIAAYPEVHRSLYYEDDGSLLILQ